MNKKGGRRRPQSVPGRGMTGRQQQALNPHLLWQSWARSLALSPGVSVADFFRKSQPPKTKKELAKWHAFERKWGNYRFANDEDCERLGLPPSFFGLLINKDGTLPHDFTYGPSDRYHLPRKLRGKDFAEFAAKIIDEWLELPKSDQKYFARFFWRDLRLRGIRIPPPIADLGFFLSIGLSDVFRMVADYIDALKSDKAFFITTRVLPEYELDIAAARDPVLTWREIKQRYWPDYKGSNQNFQKFLRERGISFRAVGKWRGKSRR